MGGWTDLLVFAGAFDDFHRSLDLWVGGWVGGWIDWVEEGDWVGKGGGGGWIELL